VRSGECANHELIEDVVLADDDLMHLISNLPDLIDKIPAHVARLAEHRVVSHRQLLRNGSDAEFGINQCRKGRLPLARFFSPWMEATCNLMWGSPPGKLLLDVV
jgi:hypothetical protein